MVNGILVKYGEIFIRGKNKKKYENQLIQAIRQQLPENQYTIRKEQGRFLIEGDFSDGLLTPLLGKLKNVVGIVALCPCIKMPNASIETIRTTALRHMEQLYGNESLSFKVETRRCDKNYPLSSQEISAEIGGYVLSHMSHLTVDVHHPQVTLRVELRTDTYLYVQEIQGLSGLPYGVSGKGLLLLSGGIDSPVAGFLMAKRGVAIDALYFHSPPYTSERALMKVKDLGKQLAHYTGSFRLWVAPFTETQLYLKEHVPEEKLTIFLKRAMLRIGELLCAQTKASGLIVGDSVGQVASQTMESICAINTAVRLPILRPLAGMNKDEIITIAKQIDTYDISIRPYEDCCTIFVPKHPELKPSVKKIEQIEDTLPLLEEHLNRCVASLEKYDL